MDLIRAAFSDAYRKLTLVALALLASLGLWLYIGHLQESRQEAQEDARDARRTVDTLETSIVAGEAVLAQRRASQDALQQEEMNGKAKTDAALADHPDWASQPVPDDVARSLLD